jgi:hypothetical protein
MSQGSDPAARIEVLTKLSVPAMRPTQAMSTSKALQLRVRKCWEDGCNDFTSLCPFHSLEIVSSYYNKQVTTTLGLETSGASQDCS